MQNGRKLTSKDDIENLASKLNIIYMIAIIGGIILGLYMGGTDGIIFGIVILFILGWALKARLLEGYMYEFRTMEFFLPENLTLEDIHLETSQILALNNICVLLENGNLSFKHGAITYEFTQKENGTFRLHWSFKFSKAFFGTKSIGDYETVRSDTALIAYTIQNITK